jgi:hypothetical protein
MPNPPNTCAGQFERTQYLMIFALSAKKEHSLVTFSNTAQVVLASLRASVDIANLYHP